MATLKITINLDNAAFNGKYLAREYEIERLLQHIGEQIFAGDLSKAVIDKNGNKCGSFEIVD